MNSIKASILLIEDEKDISRFIELELKCEGYDVDIAYDGMHGLISARQKKYDLVILDLMLPEIDGLEVCRRLSKTSDVPIIILTAKSEIKDRVEGLDSGASDYLIKPFNLEELLARVRAQLRSKKTPNKSFLEYMDLYLNKETREFRRNNTLINLSPKEFDLLYLFMSNPKHVLSRKRILETVWGNDFDGEENILEVYIHGLREKLEDNNLPRLIHTVRGIGYVLKENV